nr:immunoglobulin heavy chain junction region [Mus musculus]
ITVQDKAMMVTTTMLWT